MFRNRLGQALALCALALGMCSTTASARRPVDQAQRFSLGVRAESSVVGLTQVVPLTPRQNDAVKKIWNQTVPGMNAASGKPSLGLRLRADAALKYLDVLTQANLDGKNLGLQWSKSVIAGDIRGSLRQTFRLTRALPLSAAQRGEIASMLRTYKQARQQSRAAGAEAFVVKDAALQLNLLKGLWGVAATAMPAQ